MTPEKDGTSLASELESIPVLKTPRRESAEEKSAIIEKLQFRIKELEENVSIY